jgi:hypothetical protein
MKSECNNMHGERIKIQAMLKYYIFEESQSAYINPVTLVVRKGEA